MKVAVLHDLMEADLPPDQEDNLVQAESVSRALAALGHEPWAAAFGPDLEAMRAVVAASAPAAAFNLVESVAKEAEMAHLAPRLLEDMGLAYTGAPAGAMSLATDKLAAKAVLQEAGLPTPDWMGPDWAGADGRGGRYIIKPVLEDGSVGLDEDSVVQVRDAHELAAELAARSAALGLKCFAEAFVHGREFNVSVLSVRGRPRVLPVAETLFTGYPEAKPRVVGYRAKWSQDSFESLNTPRRFDFPAQDLGLVRALEDLALRCWRAFGLLGYARIDFRADAAGPQIIDVNPNPCISPDAGFAAAASRAGMSYEDLVGTILDDALARAGASGN